MKFNPGTRYSLLLTALLALMISFSPVQAQVIPLASPDLNLRIFLEEADLDSCRLNLAVFPMSDQEVISGLELGFFLASRLAKEARLYHNYLDISMAASEDFRIPRWKKSSLLMSLRDPEIRWNSEGFSLSVKPILGIRYIGQGKESLVHHYGGGSVRAKLGKHIGLYGNLRDNYQKNHVLSNKTWFTREEGGNYKINEGGREGGDYSEMRGGVTFSNRWGWIGLIKDKVEWGVNRYGSNIFSGRAPSFAMIYLQLKPTRWLELNYFHGWLTSEVIDSARSYYTPSGEYRKAYIPKYIAANLISVSPWRGITLSGGNSIVYADLPIQAAYLIPVMFYKSVDHTLNHGIDNQNSQMFATLSIRRIRHLHLYGNLFIDEFSKTRIGDPDRHNFFSYKAGASLSNWLLCNYQIGAEFTATTPLTFQHRMPSISFETNRYNLGHYLRDNSRDLWLWLNIRPFPFLSLHAAYNIAIHYNDYYYTPGSGVDQYPLFKDKTWSREALSFRLNYAWSYQSNLFIEHEFSNIQGYDTDGEPAAYYLNRYTSPFFQGKKNFLSLGINMAY